MFLLDDLPHISSSQTAPATPHTETPILSKTSMPCASCLHDTTPTTLPTIIESTTTTNVPPPSTPPSQSPPATPTPSVSSIPSTHPMTTRGKAGIVKTRHLLNLLAISPTRLHDALFANNKPCGFKSATKHQHWCRDMSEIQALHQNNT